MPRYQLEFYGYAVFEVLPGQKRQLVYIGKGQQHGRYTRIDRYKHLHMVKNGRLGRRAKELIQLGGKLVPQIIRRFGTDEVAALAYEDFAVDKCLANPNLHLLNDQSGGGHGRTMSAAVRRKLSEVHKGKRQTEAAKQKLSTYWAGKLKTPEHREAIRQAKLGKPRSEATKLKLRQALVGKKQARRATRLSLEEFQLLGCSTTYSGAEVLTNEQRKALRRIRRQARLEQSKQAKSAPISESALA